MMSPRDTNVGSNVADQPTSANKKSNPWHRVVFHLTGFGKFDGVPDNPTTHLIQAMKDRQSPILFAEESLGVHCELGSCVVLNVSADEGGRQLKGIHAKLSEKRQEEPNGMASKTTRGSVRSADSCDVHGYQEQEITVLIHCGVDVTGETFSLETKGYNEASFRVPDEQGYWPTMAPIDVDIADTRHVRSTTVPTADVLARLQQRGWGKDIVQESTSAGRFVCNYVFYSSLGLCEKARRSNGGRGSQDRHCMFLHVPPFEVVREEQQRAFLLDCLCCIAEALVSRRNFSRLRSNSPDVFPTTSSAIPVAASGSQVQSDPPSVSEDGTSAEKISAQPRGDRPLSNDEAVIAPHVPPVEIQRREPTSIWESSSDTNGLRSLPLVAGAHPDADFTTEDEEDPDFSLEPPAESDETEAEETRRKLVAAGFEALDVDAAMATTGSSNADVNLQFLVDMTPLLPKGAPKDADGLVIGDLNSNHTTQAVGSRSKNGTSRRKPRSGSAGSPMSMGGVSPRWVDELSVGGTGGSMSPGVTRKDCSPRRASPKTGTSPTVTKGSLFTRLRRHRRNASASAAGGDSSTTRVGRSHTPPVSQSSQRLAGSPARESSEYTRRTTGNSRSHSPPPQRVGIGPSAKDSRRKADRPAGWGTPAPTGANLRLVLLVRKDIDLGPGAIAAQCCRAALAAARKAEGSGGADALAVWRDSGETTVVLGAKHARALDGILQIAAAANLPISMVRDMSAAWAADVQADNCTVAALGPASMSSLYNVAGNLPLL